MATDSGKIVEEKMSAGPIPPVVNMCDQTPVGIIHSEEKESTFSAVGVLEVSTPAELKESEGICIFSQENLCDCEQLGSIVVSKNSSGPLVWQFLCNKDVKLDDPKFMNRGVHVFESAYLKQWVKNKGTKYIQCPLCKEGVTQAKKIEEHQIDSIDQLKEKRANAKRQRDLPLQFFTEQLILAQICESKWDQLDKGRAKANEELLRDILNNWVEEGQRETFQDKILNGLRVVVKKDMSSTFKILLGRGISGSNPRKQVIFRELAVLAAKHNAFDCLKVLCEDFNVQFDLRPITLLETVKSMNIEMVNYIMGEMKKSGSRHVCDDVFQEVIKKDMVEVAKVIIIERWHKPNERDFQLAERLDGNMWSYLQTRRNAARNIGLDTDLIESDDWGEDDSDNGNLSFGDDDDW